MKTVCAAVLLILVACDHEEPLAPEFRTANGAGPAINAPSAATAVATAFNAITVGWQDNSSNETGFEVYRSTTGPSGSFTLLASTGANVTSYVNSGLTGSTPYCYTIRAFRTTGSKTTYSAFSDTACTTTPAPPLPAAPSATRAVPNQGQSIDVTWTDNAANETGFRVERAPATVGPWTSAGTTSSNLTAFSDAQFGNTEQTVCYRVFAVNSYGDSPASNVSCTVMPAPPTNLAASLTSDGGVDLMWTDNSAVEDGYELRRDGNVVATLPANQTAYHDPGLVPDQTYWYVVRAIKDGGTSANSGIVQVVLATTPPSAPTSLTASPSSSSSVSPMWQDNSTNEAGFHVERSTDAGLTWTLAATTGPDGYLVDDSGLTTEQPVCYRVSAFNNVGESAPSNTACTTPPAGPTDLNAVFNSGGTIDLSWTDNSAVEDGYEVVYCDYSYIDTYCGVWVELPTNATSAQVLDGFGYSYYVVATKDGGISDPSITVWTNGPFGASSVRASTSRLATPRLRSKP